MSPNSRLLLKSLRNLFYSFFLLQLHKKFSQFNLSFFENRAIVIQPGSKYSSPWLIHHQQSLNFILFFPVKDMMTSSKLKHQNNCQSLNIAWKSSSVNYSKVMPTKSTVVRIKCLSP